MKKVFGFYFLLKPARVSDAINLNLGDIQRELELERIPLAIRFLPKKDRDRIGERVTFLGSDGVMMLKRYLSWREKRGEVLSSESVLFSSRNRKSGSISSRNFNETIHEAARRAGIGNGNEKYGRVRVHCLRKFFITQMTNHGMEDKIVNFLTCHKISEVDSVYWNRRVDILRRLYADRQQFLNPLHGKKNCFDLKKMKGIIGKIKSLEERIDHLTNKDFLGDLVREALKDEGFFDDVEEYESMIVSMKKDVIRLSDHGFSCQPLGDGEWLMRKKVRG